MLNAQLTQEEWDRWLSAVLFDKLLSASSARLAFALACLVRNAKGRACVGQAQLGRTLGLHERTAHRLVSQLVDRGYLAVALTDRSNALIPILPPVYEEIAA